MKSLLIILFILLCLLQYRLWLGDGNVPDMLRYEQRVEALKQESERLAQRNQPLAAEVVNLRTSDEAIEERAREDLGMIKEGEIFFQVIDQKNQSDSISREQD